jgi:hypothetical protein
MARRGTDEEDRRFYSRTDDDFSELFIVGEHGIPKRQPPFMQKHPCPSVPSVVKNDPAGFRLTAKDAKGRKKEGYGWGWEVFFAAEGRRRRRAQRFLWRGHAARCLRPAALGLGFSWGAPLLVNGFYGFFGRRAECPRHLGFLGVILMREWVF